MCDGEDPRVRAVSAAGPTRTIFPITSVTNNLSSCFFHEMADHSGSTRFQALFESALQAYERKTGVKLAQHPLALDLQSCDTVDNIIILLQGQTQAFSDFRERDRMMKAVKATVSILNPLSEAASLVDAVGLTSYPPVKAIQACIGILLDAANGVISSCDVLADLLESIGHFLDRLKVYAEMSRTPAIDKIVVNLIVELISTLALVTRKLKHRRFLVKNFFAVKDINEARRRLDRLVQEEVAATAAQILGVVHDQTENLKKFMDGSKESTDAVSKVSNQMTSGLNKTKRDKLLNDIQQWLSPPDPWKNYTIARKLRHSETGTWFVNGTMLSKWKESGPSSLLWIHGKPGSGKSVICSTIIEDIENIQKAGRAVLAMYYCDFREDQKTDLRGLLSSVLFQLCDQSNSYYDILSTFHSAHRNGAQSPDDDKLVGCLKELLKIPGQLPVYLIIDGLDECPSTSSLSSPREELLSLLEDLVEARFTNLRICVTSRPEADIKAILESLTFLSVSLHDERGQNEDIRNYIKSVISTNRNMQDWSSEHKQLVIDTLIERADGMFQYVRCQLDHLAHCLPGHIQDALDELPDTLDGTYERTLRAINNTNWETARRLLQCVTVASRPLRVDELADLLAIDFKAVPIPKYREDWRVKNPLKAVLSTCSTLLSVVDADNSQVLQFSHYSVREFLTSARFAEKCDPISRRYHISMTPAHALLGKACLCILLHLDKNVTRESLVKFPLAEYASEHWFEHARFEGVSQKADKGMKRLFDRRKHHLAVWLWICDPTVPSWRRDRPTKGPLQPCGTPLHYAVFCGLHDIVEVLVVEYPQDVNSRSFDKKSTPLLLASRRGHVEIARLLVEHGADVAAQAEDGQTPLHWTSQGGHVVLSRLLFEYLADVGTQAKDGRTPLHCACDGGHVEVAQLLVEYGADVGAQAEDGRTPLHYACEGGHVEVATLLVELGADAAAQAEDGRTPLLWVSRWGHVGLARLLLEHSADAAAQAKDGRTPLHWASRWGHVGLARLLVERGADVEAQAEDERTPLYLASRWGHVELTRLLIEHGANAATQAEDGRTPLHRASQGGHVELARLLVEHGADAAAEAEDGRTPLHLACEGGHVELARLLVEHGADAGAEAEDGRTPLHWACEGGHLELARLLLKHGADATPQARNGSTPLHRVSRWGHIELARLLVEHGADATAQDMGGLSPLDWAFRQGHAELAQFLTEHRTGAQPSGLNVLNTHSGEAPPSEK